MDMGMSFDENRIIGQCCSRRDPSSLGRYRSISHCTEAFDRISPDDTDYHLPQSYPRDQEKVLDNLFHEEQWAAAYPELADMEKVHYARYGGTYAPVYGLEPYVHTPRDELIIDTPPTHEDVHMDDSLPTEDDPMDGPLANRYSRDYGPNLGPYAA